MVKFNLPQSSKIEVGKYYKDKTNSKNLKNLGVVPANNSNSRKYIIHYELDSNILLENIQKNTNILIGINFNNEVILKQKLDKVNMKLTSYITINDNLNSPLTDNF